MNKLLPELEQRFSAMFADLARGDDLPPAQRLRCEGLMEAVVLQGLAPGAAVDELMDERYRQAFGRSLCADFGDNWRAFFPFPQIPAMARRAPVYPSTND